MHSARVSQTIAAVIRKNLTAALLVFLCFPGCQERPPEPKSRKTPQTAEQQDSKRQDQSAPLTEADPEEGEFTLEEALAGLPEEGQLEAQIRTEKGTLKCELFEDKAPVTVANFVGLSRGLRPFKFKGEWRTRPAYDGTTFHRVVKGFMIQGGDPLGTGAGEPGYVIPDEIWEGSRHDERGLLCMANRGKNTNGMQFFITDGPAPHLDGGYTIFGKCQPDTVIEKLASVPTRGDRAIDPPEIEKVTITRVK